MSLANQSFFYKAIRRAGMIAQYFLGDGGVSVKISKHLSLVALLKPFKRDGLIGRNTFIIYLFSYLSRSFSIIDKLQCIYYHYSLLSKNYSFAQLQPIFMGGVECYREEKGGENYSIVLGMSRVLEIEGSLSLYLKVNGVKTAVLSFSFINGKIIGANDEAIAYISCLQRVGRNADAIEKAIAHFNDIIPAAILLKTLEALAVSLNIKYFAGVTANNQLSLVDPADYNRFYAVYDRFWQLNGGQQLGANYWIPLPLYQKDILAIKQTHRNRVRKKRQRLQEIYGACYQQFSTMLAPEKKQ